MKNETHHVPPSVPPVITVVPSLQDCGERGHGPGGRAGWWNAAHPKKAVHIVVKHKGPAPGCLAPHLYPTLAARVQVRKLPRASVSSPVKWGGC